ncbi:MAG: hypothetical protein LBK00_11905 [Treponema sp.]|jgi:recombinational DNA repair ATPase RecF|nr:hypothetical protein [Treponema sp.]
MLYSQRLDQPTPPSGTFADGGAVPPFSRTTGKNPLLLLDDVLLELDRENRRHFLEVTPAYDQTCYTFLPEEPYH